MSGTRVEFVREFRWREDDAAVRVFPAGWSGAVSDEIAEAAREAGVLRDAPQDVLRDGAGAPPQDERKSLSAMSVAELKAVAEVEGVDLKDASKKLDIIAAIEAARAAR